MTAFDIANRYRQAGLSVLPADATQKRPTVASWKEFQQRLPTADELRGWFGSERPLCLVTGQVSGNLELLDFDAEGEKFAWWRQLVQLRDPKLADTLVIERSPSGGRHVAYRCQTPVCGNLKLAERAVPVPTGDEVTLYGKRYSPRRNGDQWEVLLTLIETRGEGGIFLCAPSPGYELLQGDFTALPILTPSERETLLQAAWELDELKRTAVDARPPETTPGGHQNAQDRPGDDFNKQGDIRAVLRRHGWALVRRGDNEYWRRPGKTDGWSATLKDRVFYVHSSNAAPFQPGQAYGPFAIYAHLEHQGDFSAAATALRREGFGDDQAAPSIVPVFTEPDEDEPPPPAPPDPGPIPESLLHIPGFIDQVMHFTLANAPYPSVPLAFCGAVALQSHLCGRKVRDAGDLRTNLYLLALASSGTGKDFPRKVNSRVLFEIGDVAALGDKFASGEGLQDALLRTPAMLFQNDEMDGVLRQVNLDREGKRESIPNTLLTLYTSASEVYPLRIKAAQKTAEHVDQPHLTLFGTATPQFFYESLSQRMLANGFFARLIIVDVGARGAGQPPGSTQDIPDAIWKTARWWKDWGGDRLNLRTIHPQPRIVPATPEAREAVAELQRRADAEYAAAHERDDEVARVAWSRTCENAQKLALIRACSVNHEHPVIDCAAIEWAAAFALHQTRRQLSLARQYASDNPFHSQCLKVLRCLKSAKGRQLGRREIMRRLHCRVQDFDQLMTAMVQQGDVVPVEIPTRTKPARGFRIA